MLKKLRIKNFQTHKDLTIDLSPTITTIVGRSDVGKSAIYRAIRWLATGTPKGSTFIRWGEKTAVVSLEVDNHKVIRKKGTSSIFVLDGKQYKAVRSDLPEDIKRTLNLAPINFQSQHDSPFWFAESAGEISRQLNAIVNLSLIDTSIKKAISKNRENKILISYLETQVDNAKKEVVLFKPLDSLLALLSKLEGVVKNESQITNERDSLQTLFKQGLRKRKVIKSLQPVVGYLETGFTMWQKVLSLQVEVGTLQRLVADSAKYDEIIKVPIPSPDRLSAIMVSRIELEDQADSLSSMKNTLIARTGRYEAWEANVVSLEKQLASEFKGRCPLCGKLA